MLTEEIMQKLHNLRLAAMAEAWRAQQSDPAINELSFDERFGLLVDTEHLARENRRIARNMKQAKLRESTACLEDVKTGPQHGIDKALVRQFPSSAETVA